MKKLLLTTALAIASTAAVFGQGTIAISSVGNTDTSPTATTSGMFFIQNQGGEATLVNNVVIPGGYGYFDILVGTTAGGVSTANAANYTSYLDFAATPGAGYDDAGTWNASVLGTAGGSYYVNLRVWCNTISTDAYTDYASALAAMNAGEEGVYVGQSGVFQAAFVQTGGTGLPNVLSAMPATIMLGAPVPEPGTFALAGLGAAALLIFRRRK